MKLCGIKSKNNCLCTLSVSSICFYFILVLFFKILHCNSLNCLIAYCWVFIMKKHIIIIYRFFKILMIFISYFLNTKLTMYMIKNVFASSVFTYWTSDSSDTNRTELTNVVHVNGVVKNCFCTTLW